MSKRRHKSSSRSHDDKERHGEQAQVSTDFCGSIDRGSGKAALRRGHPGGQRSDSDGDHRDRQSRWPRVRLVVAAQGLPVPRRRGGQQGEARSVDDAGAPDLQPQGRRGLPPHPRTEGHRRGTHRHARSLAQPAARGRDLCRQGRLLREARLEHDPAPQRDARRVHEGQADRAGRHAPAQLGSLHRGEEGASTTALSAR